MGHKNVEEAHMSTLFALCTQPMFILNFAGQILYSNSYAEEYLHSSHPTDGDQIFFCTVHPADRARAWLAFNGHTGQSGKANGWEDFSENIPSEISGGPTTGDNETISVYLEEYRHVCGTGTTKWLQWRVQVHKKRGCIYYVGKEVTLEKTGYQNFLELTTDCMVWWEVFWELELGDFFVHGSY